jgi:hypothetical protein
MAKKGLVLGSSCAAFLLVAIGGNAAAPRSAVCSKKTQSFTGAAYDLTVPAGGICEVTLATITHDLIVEPDALVFIAKTTIGVDVIASRPQSIQTGHGAGPGRPVGHVRVGRDFSISGSPKREAFHGLCDLEVGNDLSITGTRVNFGFTVGDGDLCARNGYPTATVGRDLVVRNNTAVTDFDCCTSSILIGDNVVGRNLVVSDNTVAAPGVLEVSDNRVTGDAICANNDPEPAPDDSSDGPNVVGGTNTCG